MTDEAAAKGHYFLSYSRTDERFALRLAQDLRTAGVAMWIDQLDIRPSEHWDRAIERAVRECGGLVVVLSPRSVASDNVADEISFAIDSGKSVLPVMIEKCVLPLRITRMHVIDATRDYGKALQQCLAELNHPSRQSSQPAGTDPRPAPPKQLDAATISAAKRDLAPVLGPISAILVDKEAAGLGSVEELYRVLARHITDAADRDRFLAAAPRAAAPGRSAEPGKLDSEAPRISPAEIEALSKELMPYLGPIAPIAAKRESLTCSSADDLRNRLASLIPVERDRSAFLQRVKA